MATKYSNLQGGTITDNPLSSGATTINSSAFQYLPTVASPDVLYVTLDPEGANGAPEIVQVTAHTSSATSVTVVRASQDTTARSHPSGSNWVHAMTAVDLGGVAQPGDLKLTLRTTEGSGWLNHNQAVSTCDTVYPALWEVAPAAWKSGTTLTIPDLTDVALIGAGGLAALGATTGANTATIAEANLPAHTHTTALHSHTATTANDTHNHTATVSVTSAGAHTHSAARPSTAQMATGDGTNGTTGISTSSQPGDTTSSSGTHTHSASSTVADDIHNHTVTVSDGAAAATSSVGSGTALSIVQASLGVNVQIKAT